MSTKRCYYETLEVERTTDESGLKAAFRKLAMKWHPDKNPGDATSEVRFKEINEAYEVLKDGDKRAAYDRFGHAAFEQGAGGGAGFGAGFASSFSDIFEDLFGMAGQAGGGGGRERGADLRYNMEIALEEAFLGKPAQIEIPVSVTCESCSGTGAKAGTKPKTCSICGGAGRVRQAQGFFTLERTCPGCQGRGQMIEDACPSCSGSGRVTRDRTLSVNIPQGVEDGTRIRLAGREIRGADQQKGQDKGKIPRRYSVRQTFSHCIKRHADTALAPDRRHVCPGLGRNAAKSHQEAAGIAGRIRKIIVRRDPARGGRILHQGQGLLRHSRDLSEGLPASPERPGP